VGGAAVSRSFCPSAEEEAVAGAVVDSVAAVVLVAAAEEGLGASVVEEVSAVAALADPGDVWLE